MKKRTGFSLIELGVAIVIMIMVSGVIYKSLTGFKQKQTINSGIEKDITAILQGVEEYKDMDPNADSTYANLDVTNLTPYLPTKMEVVAGVVNSMTFKSGCIYGVAPATDNLKYSLLVNCEKASSGQSWNDRQKLQLKNVIASTIDKNTSTKATINPGAYESGDTVGGFAASTTGGEVGFQISNITR